MWKTKHLKTHKRLFGFFRGYVYEFTMQSSLTQRKATLEIFTVSSICINRQLQAAQMSLVLVQSFFPYSWTNLVHQAEAETVVDLQSINFSKLIFRFQFQLKLITDYSSSLCTALHSHWFSKGKQTLMQSSLS